MIENMHVHVPSALIRVELNVLGLYNLSLNSIDVYNRLVSAHGIGMVFLFIMPLLLSFVGNWQIPSSTGLVDFTAPRLNQLSFYFLLAACSMVICAISREEGIAAGWTLYPPLTDGTSHSSSALSLVVLALHVLGLSSEGGAITFLLALVSSRHAAPPLCLSELLVITLACASVLLVLTLPVLGAGITLLLFDRVLGTILLCPNNGGDPLVFQHLF